MSANPEDVDAYLENILLARDDVLDRVLERTEKAGLPAIAVSPLQGAFLTILARAAGARRILEIGALGGYSTVCLVRALGDEGVLVTLDIDPASVEATRQSVSEAGAGSKVRIIEGPAQSSLAAMVDSVEPAFDFIFIDADKPSYARYLDLCLQLSRPGTIIVADNVVRGGKVADETSSDANAAGVRDYLKSAAAKPQLSTSALQTLGAKGHDGFAVSIVG